MSQFLRAASRAAPEAFSSWIIQIIIIEIQTNQALQVWPPPPDNMSNLISNTLIQLND